MRLFGVFLVILVIIVHSTNGESVFDTYFRRTVVNFRNIMPHGDSDLNIERLDPLVMKNISDTIRKKKIRLAFKLTNMTVTGLSKFEIINIKTSIGTLTAELTIKIKTWNVSGNYDLDGLLFKILPIYGKGKLFVSVSNFTIMTKVAIKINATTQKLSTKEIRVSFDFTKIQVRLYNILGGGELGNFVNAILNANTKHFILKNRINIQTFIQDIAKKDMDKALADLTISDLMRSPV